MKKIRNLLLVLGIMLGFGLTAPMSAYASVISVQCDGVTDSTVCKNQDDKPNDFIHTIVNLLLYIVGAVSVVMIIVGGILYTTSTGDSSRVTRAKNTVMYAIVGLIVSFVAFAVVNYVFSKFGK